MKVDRSMDRRERLSLNEAVFREVNERISDLSAHFGLEEQPLDLVCECGDPTCVERITMSRDAYDQLRADPTHFALFPGHEDPEVESIVERNGPYDVVRKHEGGPAEIAERTDPRS
jgi:hypothetical protein